MTWSGRRAKGHTKHPRPSIVLSNAGVFSSLAASHRVRSSSQDGDQTMTTDEDRDWEQALRDACFPVTLKKVFVDDPGYLAKRYRAITRTNVERNEQPFAIVTDKYKLISNQNAVDLGHEAFEYLFGSSLRKKISVFNVVLAKRKGSFFADFTTSELNINVNVPNVGSDKHTFFLRVVNSYNRTQAVRMEVGICRWICRNGIIFWQAVYSNSCSSS